MAFQNHALGIGQQHAAAIITDHAQKALQGGAGDEKKLFGRLSGLGELLHLDPFGGLAHFRIKSVIANGPGPGRRHKR